MNPAIERKPIPGFSLYEVSADGQIFLKKSSRPRKLQTNRAGYFVVGLKGDDGKKHTVSVSRAVCLAFHGLPPSPDHQAAHLNSVRKDNREENIAWKTLKENHADRHLIGTTNKHETNGRAKLTAAQVTEIRTSFDGVCRLAERYGVAHSTISDIRSRKLWT